MARRRAAARRMAGRTRPERQRRPGAVSARRRPARRVLLQPRPHGVRPWPGPSRDRRGADAPRRVRSGRPQAVGRGPSGWRVAAAAAARQAGLPTRRPRDERRGGPSNHGIPRGNVDRRNHADLRSRQQPGRWCGATGGKSRSGRRRRWLVRRSRRFGGPVCQPLGQSRDPVQLAPVGRCITLISGGRWLYWRVSQRSGRAIGASHRPWRTSGRGR